MGIPRAFSATFSEASCWAAYNSAGSWTGRPTTADSEVMSHAVPLWRSSRVPSSVRLDWKMPAADRGRKSS